MLVTEEPDTTVISVNFTVNATKCAVNNLYIASHLNCMNVVMLNKSYFNVQGLILFMIKCNLQILGQKTLLRGMSV